MVEHQSKEVVDKLSRDLKIQPAEALPKDMEAKIRAVFNVNPDRQIRFVAANLSDSLSGTLFTASATKETYLVAAHLSTAKDVVATSLFTNLTAVAFGDSEKTLLRIRYEPVTAGQFTTNMAFPLPILLEKGSVVSIKHSTAVASIDSAGIIYFFEVDPQ